ncbi:Predicted arabinose efflux permease, MFS family [Andreprevotia lacus DSM 23236]|jgi:MFS family permease|uniref:Predicted arabinose efflux permease, MFS family n=1 Tax=Andreprevotia lacus DSM 23236 TaxID=1121001 RepID=A0A1W1X8X8_9NEIS|nr:MFS transporter [Andreprevotia lacus]SMC20422.1 Predicted arabinose efflux permease, MFS family [Andreprevotia lacus DSM 23236]
MTATQPAEPIALRHHRPFVAFWLSRVLTAGGFQIMSVAIAWQMYTLTGSAMDLGLVGLVEFLPRVLFMLQIGHVADRYDRRYISALTKVLQLIAAVVLAVATAYHGVTRELIFVLAFLFGTARAFEMPAMQAMLPGIVPASVLPTAIAASASAMQAATIVAPALGGFLYAIGPVETYVLSALVYVIATVLMLRLPPQKPQYVQQGGALDSLLAGIRFIRARPDILGAISLDLFAVLLGGATALLPVFAKDILHAGPWALGLLRSAPAVGAIGMSLYLAHRPIKQRVGRIMFGAVAVFGVATIVFGLSRSFWLSLLALAVLGAADMVSMVIRGAFVQLETPDEMRGRVSAVNGLFIGASNQLGEFESGATAAWFGPVAAVVLGGVGTLIVVALWMRWFPSLTERNTLQREPVPAAA